MTLRISLFNSRYKSIYVTSETGQNFSNISLSIISFMLTGKLPMYILVELIMPRLRYKIDVGKKKQAKSHLACQK